MEFEKENCAADKLMLATFIKFKFCNSIEVITILFLTYRGG
jgi:hypothetical protein